jgi:predicted transcriptional regulator
MVETKTVQQEITTQDILSPMQDKLIKLLTNNGPMTRDEICEALGFEQYNYEYIEQYYRHGYKKDSGSLIQHKISKKQYKRRTTVYDNLNKLIKRKIVEKFSKNNHKRGRSIVLFKLKS